MTPGHDSQPLRVAHVITKLAVGGAQESVLVTCDGLPSEDFTQWIVSGTEVDEEGSLRTDVDERGIRLVDVEHLVRRIHPVADARAVSELADHMRATRPDVVHTHSSKAGFIGRAAARLARVPTVVHSVHGWSFHGEMPGPVRAAVIRAERLAARSTDALIVEGSPDRTKGLHNHIGRDDQYILIRNGIDLDTFGGSAVDPGAVRASLGVPADAWLVGTVGRLATQKDPVAMVEAVAPVMRDRSDVWFAWIGDGPLRAGAEQRTRDLGIQDRFRFVGVRRDVPDVLACLDTFALSSLWEGLPRTVTEAMASGVPVVATSVDGVVEAITDGREGLLVSPHDPPALGAALGRLADDRPLGARMAEAGRSRAREFDRREMVRRLARLYTQLHAGRSVADVAADDSRTVQPCGR